jgi:hypothetical protein
MCVCAKEEEGRKARVATPTTNKKFMLRKRGREKGPQDAKRTEAYSPS